MGVPAGRELLRHTRGEGYKFSRANYNQYIGQTVDVDNMDPIHGASSTCTEMSWNGSTIGRQIIWWFSERS